MNRTPAVKFAIVDLRE